jgi:hypothetical protein
LFSVTLLPDPLIIQSNQFPGGPFKFKIRLWPPSNPILSVDGLLASFNIWQSTNQSANEPPTAGNDKSHSRLFHLGQYKGLSSIYVLLPSSFLLLHPLPQQQHQQQDHLPTTTKTITAKSNHINQSLGPFGPTPNPTHQHPSDFCLTHISQQVSSISSPSPPLHLGGLLNFSILYQSLRNQYFSHQTPYQLLLSLGTIQVSLTL